MPSTKEKDTLKEKVINLHRKLVEAQREIGKLQQEYSDAWREMNEKA